MKLHTIRVTKYALSKRGAMKKAEGSACRIFEKTIAQYLKDGWNFKSAMVAPVRVERNWFKYTIVYEVTATLCACSKPKKEPNCKIKSCKKVKGKTKKKVYKK